MLRSSKAQGLKYIWEPAKFSHAGIRQSFFRIFASFYIDQISHQQHKG